MMTNNVNFLLAIFSLFLTFYTLLKNVEISLVSMQFINTKISLIQ